MKIFLFLRIGFQSVKLNRLKAARVARVGDNEFDASALVMLGVHRTQDVAFVRFFSKHFAASPKDVAALTALGHRHPCQPPDGPLKKESYVSCGMSPGPISLMLLKTELFKPWILLPLRAAGVL